MAEMSSLLPRKESAGHVFSTHSTPPSKNVSNSQDLLTPPIKYHSMNVIGSTSDYTDDKFYKDLKTLEKPYEIPKDYEEV